MNGKQFNVWVGLIVLVVAVNWTVAQTTTEANGLIQKAYPGGFPIIGRDAGKLSSSAQAVVQSPVRPTPRVMPQGVRLRVPQDYSRIQAAIDASSDGDTVLVSENTYLENIRFRGKAIVVASLYLVDGDTTHIAKTIIDGSGSTIADSGSVVYFIDGEDTASVLYGFTIHGGTGTRFYWNSSVTGTYWMRGGGGIFCYNAGARIIRNIIARNRIVAPISQGGGLDAVGTGAWYPFIVLERNQIVDNYIQGTSSENMEWSGGGGMSLHGVECRVVQNTVERDTAIGNVGSYGAGLAFLAYTTGRWPNGQFVGNVIGSNIGRSTVQGCIGSGLFLMATGQVVVQQNLLEGNSGASSNSTGWAEGGGMSIQDNVLSESRRKFILGNRFLGNSVNSSRNNDGAGIGIYLATCTVSGNEFRDNAVLGSGMAYGMQVPGGGAGICIYQSSFRIENNIFTGNSTRGDGGALLATGTPQAGVEQLIINNTVVDNHAALSGGGLRLSSPQNIVVCNTIFWGDSAQASPEIYTGSAVADIQYCDVQGGWSGAGNINEDPGFSLPQLDALDTESPCISAGTAVNVPSTDIHGHPRPQPSGSCPDIGAEESPLGSVLPFQPIPASLNFGTAFVGRSSDTLAVKLRNTSAHSVTIDSIRVSPEGACFFLVRLPVLPYALGVADSVIFHAVFVPEARGQTSGDVMINNHDPLDLDFSIPMQGSGLLLGPQLLQSIERVNAAIYPAKAGIVDSFLTAHPIMPLIEQDSICQFLYRANAASVTVPGDANGWIAGQFPMERLSGTDLWYRADVFPHDARLEYKFFVDGSNWILDPRNPRQALGGLGANSEVRMPDYLQPPEMLYDPAIPHGVFSDTTFHSSTLGNSRTIRVYLPPGYTATDSFAVVVFHDGLDYITYAFANRVLDYLISRQRIQPVIGVFVSPVNREPEYIGGQQNQYAAFIATELMPYIDSRYSTQHRPTERVTVGISNGGNIALWIAREYPELFGCAASYSGAIQSTTSSAFQNGPVLPLKLYVDVGTYDLPGLPGVSSSFRGILEAKGYSHEYHEWPEGHSWLNWGGHLDNALQFFIPGLAGAVEEKESLPSKFSLFQNYPNPFNPKTGIRFQVPGASDVKLVVYDLLGREVAMLVNERKEPGSYEVSFDGSGLASGMYIYRLTAGSFTQSRAMILLK